MNTAQENNESKTWFPPIDEQTEKGDFAAPLGSLERGRLVFASGAAGVTIQADPGLPDLYRAHFERHVPRVWTHDGVVTIGYRRFPFFDWLVYSLREPLAEVRLNGTIPWEFEFREGVSRLAADLRQVQVPSLDVLGGASSITLRLGPPANTGFIHFSGGVSDLTIHRPAGVGLRLQIGHGVSRLALDNQHFSAMGGETRLETPDFKSTTRRYEVCIAGGASNVTIDREGL